MCMGWIKNHAWTSNGGWNFYYSNSKGDSFCEKKFATSFAYKESTQDIEPLVDYKKSHIVTFIEYLEIIQQKKLDKGNNWTYYRA